VRHSLYGECDWQHRAIFVNARQNQYQIARYLTKLGRKRTGYRAYYKTVKATYRYKLQTLVHELVHYRFPSMQHGRKFEQRIKEILSGTQFEPKHLTQSFNAFEWTISGITRMPSLSTEEQIKKVSKSTEFLHKNNRPDILQELRDKYTKYIDGKEIEAGFNLFQQEFSKRKEEADKLLTC
jgi:hypothetical protein